MSRIGKKPIPVPGGVKVAVKGGAITVEGSLGKLGPLVLQDVVDVTVEEGQILVTRKSDDKRKRRRSSADSTC